jgi:hypothetical protein
LISVAVLVVMSAASKRDSQQVGWSL